MEMIKTLAVLFVPCVLIYLVFEFRLITILASAFERWAERMPKKDGSEGKHDNMKPGLGTWLYAFLFPLTLLLLYKGFYEHTAVGIEMVVSYAIIYGIFASAWLSISRWRHRTKKDEPTLIERR